MKILFQARTNLFSVPGGDTVQIVKTREYLERLGIACDIVIAPVQNYEPYELVHLFNFTRIQETCWFARSAKRKGKPVVLSTIYWDNTEVERLADVGWRKSVNRHLSLEQIEWLKGLWRLVIEREVNQATLALLLRGFSRLQRETIQYIDLFLPNAECEMALFQARFGSERTLPYMVVPNGVDVDVAEIPERSGIDERYEEYADCVLCVGRIDGRKNQLNLVRALRDCTIPVVFVGRPAPNHSSYMQKVIKESRAGMYFLGQIPHEQVRRLYRLAKVHCIPSWYETPGLASLEAAVAGCNVVVTDRGSTREYFGDHAYYCEPDSVSSIRDAVYRAYSAPKDVMLRNLVLENYTWTKTAQTTAEAYRRVLSNYRAI